MTGMLRRLRGDSRGVTLIELLVTMILMGIVGSLVLSAVIQTQRVITHNDDENRGLQDAKVILDRLGRDVREARGVVCDGGLADPTDPTSADPYCKSHLQVWIDFNSDYIKQDSEVVTWRLQADPDGVHFDVYRFVGTVSPTSKIEAKSLIVKIAFSYDAVDGSGNPAFDHVQQVLMNMKYDAIVGRGVDIRTVAFAARLRNKGA